MLVDEVSILLKDDHIQVEENVALVWRPWPDNYYHRVVESVFNYQLSCTYLKLCTHASVTSQLTAIFTDKPRQFLPMDWESNFPAVYEAPKCYTKDFLELHLPRSLNQTIIARHAVAGVGPHDRSYGTGQRHTDAYKAPPNAVSEGFRDVMASCLGLSYMQPRRSERRKVALINRSSSTGRHMQNADVIVDAVVIEHGFRPDDHKLHELSLQLMVDLSVPASFIGVSPAAMDAVIPKLDHFLKQKEFLALPADSKLEILEKNTCTPNFKGPCDYWKHFTFIGEWTVMEPALQLATQLIANGSHVVRLLDNSDGWRYRHHKPA